MCVLRWIWAGLICLSLSACFGLPQGGVSRSGVTGLAGGWSAVEIAAQPAATRHHVIFARGYFVGRGDRYVSTLRLGKAWDGVHTRLRIDSAWANGRQLPFKPAGRYEGFTHDMANQHSLIGTLHLSPAIVEKAAQTGLNVRLLGPDGSFDVMLGANLFRPPHDLAADDLNRAALSRRSAAKSLTPGAFSLISTLSQWGTIRRNAQVMRS